MRIIAGSLKGRRLASPRWMGLRPTSDKLRETLFNILASRIEGARVLDGYAGTGALGIEALSRGAAHVTFIERDARAIALIRENLERCRIGNGYAIIRGSFERAASRLPESEGYDLILLDPPYEERDLAGAVAAAGRLLLSSGVLVLEHSRRLPAPPTAGAVQLARDVGAGDSGLAFYRGKR